MILIFLLLVIQSCSPVQSNQGTAQLRETFTTEVKVDQEVKNSESLNPEKPLVLKLELSTFQLSVKRSTVRVFLDLPDATHLTSTDEKNYIGSFSTFGDANSYAFNLNDFLSASKINNPKSFLNRKITLTLVPVTFDENKSVVISQIEVKSCTISSFADR
ncbi:MAG: hypothetical protein HOP08_18665 [Cyclobacteriaceae bacterium]|nr:hypothetical protein [Cyclobacteriaceae bacterium]